MHLYILTRGVKHDVDRFIDEIRCKYVPFKYKGADHCIQVGVRPIQLWEVVFPEEHLQVMMATMGGELKTQHKKHEKFLFALRKILGVEPMPEFVKGTPAMPCYNANVEVSGIGIKKDYWRSNDEKETSQEKKDGYFEAI